MSSPADPAKVQRELRVRIARSRRRIDAQLDRMRGRGRRLVAWKSYLGRHPVRWLSAVAALGATAIAFQRWRRGPKRPGRRTGMRRFYRLARRLAARFARRFTRAATDIASLVSPSEGGDDGRR